MKSITFGLINGLLAMNTVLQPGAGFGQFRRAKKPVQSAEQKQTALAKAELKRERKRVKRHDDNQQCLHSSYQWRPFHWQM